MNNLIGLNFSTNAGHDNVIYNNIIYSDSGGSIAYLGQPENTLIDYNCYYTQSGPSPGTHSIVLNPLFIDINASDFHLQSNSPCIDRGDPDTAPTVDFDGNPVPLDGDGNGSLLADLGVFEFVPPMFVEPLPSIVTKHHSLQVHPNPVNGKAIITLPPTLRASVRIRVFNVLGRQVESLSPAIPPSGYLSFDATRFSSGQYFLLVTNGQHQYSSRLIITK